MANRKAVSRDALNKWLTDELQIVEDCDGSSLSVQYLLAVPDADGCNWSGVVARVGPKTTAEQLQPVAVRIADKARALFNLTE